MFLKQYNYKPRSNSDASNNSMSEANNDMSDAPSTGAKGAASSNNSQPGAVKGGLGATPTPANNMGGAGSGRRPSGSAFSGLTTQKRSIGDAESEAKKASFMEQKPGTDGVIGNVWKSLTRGN